MSDDLQTLNLLFMVTNMYISRWQTFIGAVLLLLSGKLGWVEMSCITRYFIPTTSAGSF